MNLPALFRSLGFMVLLLGIAMVVSIGLSALVPAHELHETGLDLGGWAISWAIAMVTGISFLLLSKYLSLKFSQPPAMRRREAMGLVGCGWFICSIVVALPYFFCAPNVPFVSAIFEGVSGLTTTGATIFIDLESLPKSILMWRSVTQWVGGMGILAMFVVVLSGMTASSKTLIGAESSLSNADIQSLRQTMRRLWLIYLGFTLVCCFGLWAMGLSPFQALNHALTACSTGGFSTENASTGAEPFHPLSKMWLMLFMILGAVSFPLYLSVLKRKWNDLYPKFEEVVWFLGIIILCSIVLILERVFGQFEAAGVIDIIFNTVSIITSTGYVSSDYQEWSRVGVGILILLMIIGGCSGSTAGGLKVSRMILWLRFLHSTLRRTFRPKVVNPIKLNGRSLPENGIEQLFLVISLFGFFALTGTLLFQLFDPNHSLLGALSAVVSCLGNIGPALDDMFPGDRFATTTTSSKILFSVLMICGRLEYVALLVLFSGQLWKKY